MEVRPSIYMYIYSSVLLWMGGSILFPVIKTHSPGPRSYPRNTPRTGAHHAAETDSRTFSSGIGNENCCSSSSRFHRSRKISLNLSLPAPSLSLHLSPSLPPSPSTPLPQHPPPLSPPLSEMNPKLHARPSVSQGSGRKEHEARHNLHNCPKQAWPPPRITFLISSRAFITPLGRDGDYGSSYSRGCGCGCGYGYD